jgi:alanine racemase
MNTQNTNHTAEHRTQTKQGALSHNLDFNAYSWIEVSKSALLANVEQYKKIIQPDLLGSVVKGNGYGHDIKLVSHVLDQSLHVDYLCVAYLSEALMLRDAGIAKPILVMSCLDRNPALAAGKNIELLISDEQDVAMIEQALPQEPIRVHLKIDTGLTRFGVTPAQAMGTIKRIHDSSSLILHGIYTHFSESQNPDQTFTNTQKSLFVELLDLLKHHEIRIPLIHAANSSATTVHELPMCNFYRVGIGTYGWWPTQSVKERTQQKYPELEIRPALSWKTYIDHIKYIPANIPVGYDLTFTSSREIRAALLPVGYADGYDFRLANKGQVLIHNQLAPIIGKVCMNVAMVDVTDIPAAQRGDEVTLLGNHPGLTTHDLANHIGSKNAREALVRINPALPRILVD